MNKPVATALSVGTDTLLMRTRNEVLRKAGLAIVSAHSVRDAFRLFISDDFDCIVLCHSLPQQDRKRLVDHIRRYSTSVPIITVADIFHEIDSFVDVTTDNNPKVMLADISRVARLALPIDMP